MQCNHVQIMNKIINLTAIMDDHAGRKSIHAGGKWETMNFLVGDLKYRLIKDKNRVETYYNYTTSCKTIDV